MKKFIRQSLKKIRQINREYAVPSITMSRGVWAALILLRVYLIVMLALTLYKFVTAVR